MPILGAFCPMPLRLDRGGASGWAPEEHARFCADLDAVVTTAALIDMRWTKSGSTITVTAYKDMLRVGPANKPTFIVNGSGDVDLVFDARFTNDFEQSEPVVFQQGIAMCNGGGGVYFRGVVELKANRVRVRTFNPAGAILDAPTHLRLW